MDDFIYTKNEFLDEIKKLIRVSTSNKKLLILTGNKQMGKTFTLKNIQEKFLRDNLVIHLSLNNNSQSNPLILKNAIIQSLQKISESKKLNKKIDIKKFVTSTLKSFSINFGITPISLEAECSIGQLIDNLESILGGLKKELQDIQHPEQAYVEQLFNITCSIAEASGEMIYILIDNCQFADDEIKAFIDILKLQNIKLGFFVTIENTNDDNKTMEWILDKILHDSDREIKELECFNKETIIHYLNKNLPEVQTIEIDKTAEKIYQLTSGVPGYVSLLTNDIYSLDDIEKNTSFRIVMNNRFNALSADEKELAEIIHLNKDLLPSDIFNYISESKASKYDGTLSILMNKKIISEHSYNGKYTYKLNFPAMIPQIPHYKEKNIATMLKNAYIHKKNYLDDSYDYYGSLIHLSKILNNNEELAINGLNFASYLRTEFKSEIAIDILKDIIDNYQLSLSDKVKLSIELIENLYIKSQMTEIKNLYKSYSEEELQKIKTKYSYIFIHVAQAFYYLNEPNEALKILETISYTNEIDKLEKVKLICSSFDLIGEYTKSKKSYENFINDLRNDEQVKAIFLLYIQMIEKKYQVCVNGLCSAINYFENIAKDSIKNRRFLATGYNNLGIEYLMNGEIDKSKRFFEKSIKQFDLFGNDYKEKNFPLNNLGLAFLLEKNYLQANSYFEKAYLLAISPLQKSYILQNQAITQQYLQNDILAKKTFIEAEKYSTICPDPVVKNYTLLNAKFLGIELPVTLSYLEKDQLKMLNYKRALYLSKTYSSPIESDRRKLFAKQEFEPCELMFFN